MQPRPGETIPEQITLDQAKALVASLGIDVRNLIEVRVSYNAVRITRHSLNAEGGKFAVGENIAIDMITIPVVSD